MGLDGEGGEDSGLISRIQERFNPTDIQSCIAVLLPRLSSREEQVNENKSGL